MLNHPTIESFIQLLNSPYYELVEQAVWGLGNIAGDGTGLRDHIIDLGAVQPIASYLVSAPKDSSFIRNGSWALSNLCRGRPGPKL